MTVPLAVLFVADYEPLRATFEEFLREAAGETIPCAAAPEFAMGLGPRSVRRGKHPMAPRHRFRR